MFQAQPEDEGLVIYPTVAPCNQIWSSVLCLVDHEVIMESLIDRGRAAL